MERATRPLRLLSDTDFCLSAGGDMVCRVADPEHPALCGRCVSNLFGAGEPREHA